MADRSGTTGDLQGYFLNKYRDGRMFRSSYYIFNTLFKDLEPDHVLENLWCFKHTDILGKVTERGGTGIKVWRDAIDLSSGPGADALVVFHYTDAVGFRNITNTAKEEQEVFASLKTEGDDANAWWGKGVYTVFKAPDEWEDGIPSLLDNNFRNMMARDLEKEGQDYVTRKYKPRAEYCIPIIVDRADAYDVSKRATPEMEAKGKPPGENLAGKLLTEPGRPERQCVVVRMQDAGVVTSARGRLLNALRKRDQEWSETASINGSCCVERHRLVEVLRDLGHLDEAEEKARALVESGDLAFLRNPRTKPMALRYKQDLASVLLKAGKLDEAERLCRHTTQEMEKIVDSSESALKSDQAAWLNNLGSCLLAQGKLDEAEKSVLEALEISQTALGGTDPQTLWIIENQAAVLFAKKDKAQAVACLTRAVEGYEEAYGAWHATAKRARQRLEECDK